MVVRLKSARVLEVPDAAPSGGLVAGSTVEFVLSAAGLTHRVESFVTDVEPPRFIRWRYTKGAIGAAAGPSRRPKEARYVSRSTPTTRSDPPG